MMRAPYQKNNGISDDIITMSDEIIVQVIIRGNTNDTLIAPVTNAGGVVAYVEIGGVQPSTSGTGLLYLQDADANFGALDSNADPSSIGLLVLCGDARTPVAVATGSAPEPVLEVLRKPSAATLTITNRGGSTNGVTTSKNLAFTISCAGLDFDSGVTNYEFLFRVVYARDINAVTA